MCDKISLWAAEISRNVSHNPAYKIFLVDNTRVRTQIDPEFG